MPNIGQIQLGTPDKYKYIGNIMNNKINIKDSVTETTGKAEVAYQIIMIRIDKNFTGNEMRNI